MRLRESSMPQLPPRAAMGTPLTRMTRYGVNDSLPMACTAGDVSPAGVSDSAHPCGVRLIAS